MLRVERRQKKPRRPRARLITLIVLLALLAGLVLALTLARRETPTETEETAHEAEPAQVIVSRAPEEVAAVGVTLREGESWVALRDGDELIVQGDDGFPIDRTLVNGILQAVSQVETEHVLAEKAEDWQDRLADFGLDSPRALVEVRYVDGERLTLRVGNRMSDGDRTYYYLSVDGDGRLMTLDVGTEEELNVSRPLLRAVTQPVIHKARLDDITLATPERTCRWTLEGDITDPDAADRWLLTEPLRYPADGEAVANLRTTLANFVLGAWEAEADEASLARCGFDHPRLTLTAHMAAGSLTSTGADSAITEYPESTFKLIVGGERTELTDYVLWDGQIYVASRFSLSAFLNLDPLNTLSRYPVLTSLSNLRELTVTDDSGTVTYAVTYEQQVNPDNSLVTDEDGRPVLSASVTRNGEPFSWEAFENAYQRMLLVTVSGALPEDWQPDTPPHTRMVFRTRTGVEHTVALYAWDAMHDAVEVDGEMVFYLIRDGLRLDL